jgi:hypothetical protein
MSDKKKEIRFFTLFFVIVLKTSVLSLGELPYIANQSRFRWAARVVVLDMFLKNPKWRTI